MHSICKVFCIVSLQIHPFYWELKKKAERNQICAKRKILKLYSNTALGKY